MHMVLYYDMHTYVYTYIHFHFKEHDHANERLMVSRSHYALPVSTHAPRTLVLSNENVCMYIRNYVCI